MSEKEKWNWESFKVTGDEILTKVKEIVKEGNARKIIIKNEKDEIIMEFPLTIGAIGAVLAPLFAAVGTLAALATNCTILVEKKTGEEGKQ
jgi:predicted aconitase with swiveling domain